MEFVSSGTEQSKVRRIQSEDVSEKIAELARSFRDYLARSRNLECIICKLRQIERGQQSSAIHMRISTHAAIACRRKLRQLRQ